MTKAKKIIFLTDTRDPHCRAATYDDVLPKASIIIIFTNEAWSPLIRTVWSVLDNTEAEHLHEIILVDDFSDKTHLKGKLTRYIQKKFPSKVKLLRLKSRLVQFTYVPTHKYLGTYISTLHCELYLRISLRK